MKKFTSFIREMAEEGEKKLKHLEHAEDHIINAVVSNIKTLCI